MDLRGTRRAARSPSALSRASPSKGRRDLRSDGRLEKGPWLAAGLRAHRARPSDDPGRNTSQFIARAQGEGPPARSAASNAISIPRTEQADQPRLPSSNRRKALKAAVDLATAARDGDARWDFYSSPRSWTMDPRAMKVTMGKLDGQNNQVRQAAWQG